MSKYKWQRLQAIFLLLMEGSHMSTDEEMQQQDHQSIRDLINHIQELQNAASVELQKLGQVLSKGNYNTTNEKVDLSGVINNSTNISYRNNTSNSNGRDHIQDSHAVFYIIFVLFFFSGTLLGLLVKYLRRERETNKLEQFYDNYMENKFQMSPPSAKVLYDNNGHLLPNNRIRPRLLSQDTTTTDLLTPSTSEPSSEWAFCDLPTPTSPSSDCVTPILKFSMYPPTFP
ncbi:unnamed protein product, partial [Meganyctiphanes norvegica]